MSEFTQISEFAESVGGHLVQHQLKSPSSSPSPPRLHLGGLGLDSGYLSGVRQVHAPPSVGLILKKNTYLIFVTFSLQSIFAMVGKYQK